MTAADLVLVLREAAKRLREANLPGRWTLELHDEGIELRGDRRIGGDQVFSYRSVVRWDGLLHADAPVAFFQLAINRGLDELHEAVQDPTR